MAQAENNTASTFSAFRYSQHKLVILSPSLRVRGRFDFHGSVSLPLFIRSFNLTYHPQHVSPTHVLGLFRGGHQERPQAIDFSVKPLSNRLQSPPISAVRAAAIERLAATKLSALVSPCRIPLPPTRPFGGQLSMDARITIRFVVETA